MNNIGTYSFTEEGKEKIIKLAELTEQDESFVNDALMYMALKTFNIVLSNANPSVLENIKKHADDAELLQSYFRSQISEDKVKDAYTATHNEYITDFIEDCGGNYSAEVIAEIEKLKF